MGKAGPKPKPTSLRLLHGDRRDRVNVDEPVPSELPVEPPDYLDADARAVWDRLAGDLERKGILTAWDTDAFAAYCTAVVYHRRAAELVNRTNVLLTQTRADRPGITRNPALQVVEHQAALLRALAHEFGLTPSARSEMRRPSRAAPEDAERLLS